MTRQNFTISTITLLLLTGCAWMKPHYNDAQMHSYLFNKFDANEDGVITKEEYMEFIDERFDKMDSDGNGTITKEDLYDSRFYTFLPELAEAVFRDSDLDNSETITREEMLKAEEARFKVMDRNGDGQLTKDEFVVNDMSEYKK
jgi:Ca2+-binding EF-hand superfamily protein